MNASRGSTLRWTARAFVGLILAILIGVGAALVSALAGLKLGSAAIIGYLIMSVCLSALYVRFIDRPVASWWPLLPVRPLSRTVVATLLPVGLLVTGVLFVSWLGGHTARSRHDFHWQSGFPMMLAIAVALFEELIFRGAIFGSLKRRLGLRTSVVVTSAIWTACHLVSGFTLVAGPYYFFVSVMLCVLAEYSSSLMPGVLFHVILDFTVGFARFDWDHILVYPGVFSFDVSHVNEWFSAWMTIGFIAISIGLRPAAQKPGTKACPALNS